jgi:hypothetical protein
MDPLSISMAAVTITAVCVTITSSIFTYASKVKAVGEEIGTLETETAELSTTLGAVKKTFDDPVLSAIVTDNKFLYNHWKEVKRSMGACEETLKVLEKLFENIASADSGLLKKVEKQIKLFVKNGEMTLCNRRIKAYRTTLKFSLNLIGMYVSLP